jgi:hypothetical protein
MQKSFETAKGMPLREYRCANGHEHYRCRAEPCPDCGAPLKRPSKRPSKESASIASPTPESDAILCPTGFLRGHKIG